jgi:anti-sigma factor RsiW
MSERGRHPGDRLAALVDGRLGEPDRSRVIAHLTQCPDCLAEYDAQLALKHVLGGLGVPPAPDALRGRLSELLAEAPREPDHAPHRIGLPAKVGAVVVVLAVATLGGGYVAGGTPEGQAVVPPVDQYVRDHAAVSVGVPLSAPVVYQLVPAPPSLVVVPAGALTDPPAPVPVRAPGAVGGAVGEPAPARPATGARAVVLRHTVPVTLTDAPAVRP